MKILVKILFFYILPFIGLPLVYQKSVLVFGQDIALFRILLPFLTMSCVVGFWSGVRQPWGIYNTFTIRQVLPQIGLIYSTVINAIGLLWASVDNSVLVILLTTISVAIAGTLYDIPILHYGFLKVRHQKRFPDLSPVRIALLYGPYFFGCAALVLSVLNICFIPMIQYLGFTPALIAAFLLSLIPFVSYFEWNRRKKLKIET
jgi:O-antigen/teichoic acid export membrane protein